jgi:putative colanic acid biosynthesis acetyltransferase WcaF
MTRQAHYNAADHIPAKAGDDPYKRPAFPLQDRLRRLLWNTCWLLFYRPSPRPLHAWRSMLLRAFGASMGPRCHFYPGSKVYAPWNLVCDDGATAGDGAELYNPAPLRLGSHAIISQGAFVCGATHDYDDPNFPLLAYRMEIGAYAWICARACVGPAVQVGEGAVLGLGSVASRDLEPWTVYAGAPAVRVKGRRRSTPAGQSSSSKN